MSLLTISQEADSELKEMTQELEDRKAEFEKEQQEMRPLLSEEEYKQLIEKHRQELNELEQKLDLQRRRQQQSLLDKLAARRVKRGQKVGVYEMECGIKYFNIPFF